MSSNDVFDVEAADLQKDTAKSRNHVIPNGPRNALVIVVGEFFGTFMFLLLSFIGAQTAINNNDPRNPDPNAALLPMSLLYIACAFGTALAANVWIFFRVTGGMFNPAVTLGLVLVGAVKPLRALLIVPTQLVAGIAAAAVVNGILPGPLKVGNNLSHGTSPVQGLFLEMFLTCQLVLTVYFLAVEKHRATFLAPIGVGISVFIAHIAGTNYTGTSVNPARSFGPAVFVGFPTYHWIYWLGPVLGSFLAFGVYTIMKWLDYSTANPGQDSDDIDRANSSLSSSTKKEGITRSQASLQSHSPLVESHGRPRTGRDSVLSDEDISRGREASTRQHV